MIRSMTGFGEAERDTPAGRLRIEVKTVNHRYFNLSLKSPASLDRFETQVGDALKRHIARGHVSVALSLKRAEGERDLGIRADLEKARAYLAALEALRHELNVPGAVNLAMLSHYTDLFRGPDVDRSGEIDAAVVTEVVEAAASGVKALREAEGLRLAADLEQRLSAMSAELDAVSARAPARLVEQRDRLRQQVKELSEQVDVDEDRLAREVAYLAERWDVNEEVVRFRSHVELFREALAADGAEPVGKRLGFLAQEMQREANTIASKANDAAMARSAVALKEEIERLREQVENVE
ncbi:MAG: YicC family protein [Gemmatimonadetes bacterium]|nr:YicC family protein [Gemmatimonadota bacterium]